MADLAGVETEFGSLGNDIKKALVAAFRYVLSNLTLGAPEHAKRAKNFQWYWFEATTSSVANQEFSFPHGLGHVPTVVIPVLPLGSVGARTVNLQVTRAADVNRVYLSSPSTSAAVVVLVE